MASEGTAKTIYDEAIVVDGLNVSNWDSPAVFKSLDAGGVTAINATIAIHHKFLETMDNISAWLQRAREHDDTIELVTTVDGILQSKKGGKTGVILGWQNATPIENDLDRLALFHRLGVRIIQITYNERNLLGNGCLERTDEGLSNFGVDAVREMNGLGILIDLSHVGDRTTLEVIELSERPVACTHANARAFYEHPRNKTDDALRLIAEKGGVIGATAWPLFLRNGWESSLSDYIDAIDDMVERVGIDHVGMGTDYTQGQTKEWFDWLISQQGTKPSPRRSQYPDLPYHPEGLETPDKMPSIAAELMGRGYGEADIKKVLGGNWMRLFQQVWGG